MPPSTTRLRFSILLRDMLRHAPWLPVFPPGSRCYFTSVPTQSSISQPPFDPAYAHYRTFSTFCGRFSRHKASEILISSPPAPRRGVGEDFGCLTFPDPAPTGLVDAKPIVFFRIKLYIHIVNILIVAPAFRTNATTHGMHKRC